MTWSLDRRSLITAFGASAFPLPAFGASPRSDPEWVHALLTALHPGLYRYQSPAAFERRFATFARDWQARPTLEARYLTLTRLMAAIRCGHSHCNPYNQKKDAVIARLTAGRGLLPFRFRWIGGQMVVSGDPHRTGLAPGTVITAVDRVPTTRILATLLPFARADGSNDAKRRALMEVRGQDEFEEFDLFHPLLFPTGSTVLLDLVRPERRREQRSLATVDRAARLAARTPSPKRGSDEPLWTLDQRGPTAVLTMPTWAVYDSKWDWPAWLERSFATLAANGTRGLVIDLRDNEGGKDCGDQIIAHLAAAPVATEATRRLARFRSVPRELRPPLDTWDKSFVDLGKDAAPYDARFVELKSADSGGSAIIAPAAPRFGGKVALLISAINSSATFSFARRMQENRLATLVGEPTGGNLRGINGGAYFFVRLPDSGLEFDLPLIGYFPKTPQRDAGIVPDVAVPLTAAALAAGRDNALERALAIVA
jgi:hypothetical protein